MNPLVHHVASGQVFFTGIVLMIVAAQASQRPQPMWRRGAAFLFVLAAIAIAISSTAIPYWCYALAIAATLPWVFSGFRKEWQHWAPHCLLAGWLIAAAYEMPYHFTSTLRPATKRALTVIGDSVTAGVDGDQKSETWPTILARKHQIEVQDISHVGETAGSAIKRVQKIPVEADIVFVEIGGNDLLGSTTAANFERDLDALLTELAKPNRQIMMLELPLPPFYHEYGRAQRTIAAKHHVALVPKRVFLSILAGNDATLDTIHLSGEGHERMAEVVWGLVKSGFESR